MGESPSARGGGLRGDSSCQAFEEGARCGRSLTALGARSHLHHALGSAHSSWKGCFSPSLLGGVCAPPLRKTPTASSWSRAEQSCVWVKNPAQLCQTSQLNPAVAERCLARERHYGMYRVVPAESRQSSTAAAVNLCSRMLSRSSRKSTEPRGDANLPSSARANSFQQDIVNRDSTTLTLQGGRSK